MPYRTVVAYAEVFACPVMLWQVRQRPSFRQAGGSYGFDSPQLI